MKLYCLFLSFSIVNVLAVTETDYKKQVYISNYFFQSIESKGQFGDLVDKSVEALICSNMPITFLALMLVAPENTTDYDSDYLQKLINNEKLIQNRIRLDHGNEVLIPAGIDFSKKSLVALGITRRSITYPSLKRLLHKVERGLVTRFNSQQTCDLIALLKTGTDRRYRIKEVRVEEDSDCRLIEIFDIVSTYIKFDDGFYKIADHTLNKISKLTNEIL
ncbi:uncharacterized protein LOC126841402 [Adelges cooleyi]|uniref:uncharacterized protein LOC126841402 n=1 Tax=Adelges cooleyi TaxID=133065 RepID=UPI00218038A1|nr:uncharacterized protein LOC126841402 [Adelges cooleyi]